MLTYDGAQAVQARTWAGAVAWTASWGPGVDHLVSVEKEGLEYFALDDGKGSVVGWLDGVSNQVVGRAEYTPEGLGRFVDEVAGTSCEEVDGARCPRPLDMPSASTRRTRRRRRGCCTSETAGTRRRPTSG